MTGGTERGLTLVELLVATALGIVVVGAVATLVAAGYVHGRVQPEANDTQQRLRAGVEAIRLALAGAGAGLVVPTSAREAGSGLPAVLPQRFAVREPDAELAAFTDRLTVLGVPDDAPHAGLAMPLVDPGAPLPLAPLAGCAAGDAACGFREGDLGVVLDLDGHTDLVRAASVAGNEIAHIPAILGTAYDPARGARVVRAAARAFLFDRASGQLREYRGRAWGVAAIDHVVAFRVQYFGDAVPPTDRHRADGVATCLTEADGTPRLAVLVPDVGPLVELTPERLSDGPACGRAPFRFDGDLLRLRLARVTLRVETPSASLRGLDPGLFARPGRAPGATVPDQEVTFDVALRNRS